MDITRADTAPVVIDPQNDVLSETGVYGETVVAGPHKAWGPQTSDLVFQLRKRKTDKVILAGMLANLCVESHLRELVEQGFEVAVVKDATAAPRHPTLGDGHAAALVNYNFIASAVLTTAEAVAAMR